MSRLPNPFLGGQGNNRNTPQQQQRPSTPGFLLMTRPPTGSNSFGGGNYQSPAVGQGDSFIPFSNISNSSNITDNNRYNNNQGGSRFGFNRGGDGAGRHGNNSRFAHPYQQSPGGGGRIPPSPRGRHGQGQMQGFSNTPGGRYNSNSSGLNFSTPRGSFSGNQGGRFHSGNRRGSFHDRQDRFYNDFNTPKPNGQSKGGWDRSRGRGPISSIPVDKFVSESMVEDPWSEFYDESDSGIQVEEISPTVASLDDSEIIIDSDTSVIVENSYDEVISDTEVDSSPVHDTGSDSPNVATSSTSEKDTGSDSGSDT